MSWRIKELIIQVSEQLALLQLIFGKEFNGLLEHIEGVCQREKVIEIEGKVDFEVYLTHFFL